MAENMANSTCNATNHFKEAVCIEVGRIFDSCSDKDCLEDLQVFFTCSGQSVIDKSTLIKCKSAEVLDVYLTVEPVSFNRGFYAVDMTFYFRVNFSAYECPISSPVTVRGLAYHTKKVILYGSEGNVKTFCSGECIDLCNSAYGSNLPKACVKVATPITLGSRIVECAPMYAEPLGPIPDGIRRAFDSDLVIAPHVHGKTALVTLGVFSIVTLARDVQIMVPAYDYVLPEKDCTAPIPSDDPCEVFRKIKFPTDEFFPESLNDLSCDD